MAKQHPGSEGGHGNRRDRDMPAGPCRGTANLNGRRARWGILTNRYGQLTLTFMDCNDEYAVLARYLAQAQGDPLQELRLTLSLREQIEVLQLQAVQTAALAHTWSEIGSALGVTKQAAHRRFLPLLAEEVRAHKRTLRQAQRAGQSAEAGAALTATLEGVEVLRKAARRP